MLSVLLWLVSLYALALLLSIVSERILALERRHHSVHFLDAPDGWRLALTHHRCGKSSRLPALLVPGAGMNSTLFEVGNASLVDALLAEGRDVWVLDPRGRGESSRPRLWGRHRRNWTLDDYVEIDLPAAVAGVLERSGAPALHLVGFGLGALSCYPYLAKRAREVRSMVSLAGPAFFSRQRERHLARPLTLLRGLRLRLGARLAAPLLGRIDLPLLSSWQMLDNIDARDYRRALVNALEATSPREITQLADWIEHDRYQGLDDGASFRDALPSIETPLFFICGPRDPWAPPSMVEATREACSASKSRILVASRPAGCSVNYGHLDLLLGRSAARDIYPPLIAWLDEHEHGQQSALSPADGSSTLEGADSSLPF